MLGDSLFLSHFLWTNHDEGKKVLTRGSRGDNIEDIRDGVWNFGLRERAE